MQTSAPAWASFAAAGEHPVDPHADRDADVQGDDDVEHERTVLDVIEIVCETHLGFLNGLGRYVALLVLLIYLAVFAYLLYVYRKGK